MGDFIFYLVFFKLNFVHSTYLIPQKWEGRGVLGSSDKNLTRSRDLYSKIFTDNFKDIFCNGVFLNNEIRGVTIDIHIF